MRPPWLVMGETMRPGTSRPAARLLGQQAAVDDQRGAADVGGLVGDDESDRGRDVRGLAHPLERYGRRRQRWRLRRLPLLADQTRDDGGDADAVPREAECQ